MTTSRRSGPGAERGAVLILTLLFVSFFGLAATFLLAETETSLKVTRVNKSHKTAAYAADAGIDWAADALRVDPTMCAEPDPAANRSTTIRVDGKDVVVACEGQSGWRGWLGYSVVTTDTANSLATQGAAGEPKIVDGPVWSTSLTDAVNLQVRNGNAFERRSGSTCSTDGDRPAGLTVGPSPPYRYACVPENWPGSTRDQMTLLPATAPPTVRSPAPLRVGACDVFLPGTYKVPPVLARNRVYFASGVYYFENVALDFTQAATVLGGKQGPLEKREIPSAGGACNSVDESTVCPGCTGTGVRFVLGGTSSINFGNTTTELFARDAGGATEGRPMVSIVAVPAPVPAGSGWLPSTLTTASNILKIDPGSPPQVAVHGLVFTPKSFVEINARGSSVADFQGGIVAGRLMIHSSASAHGLAVSSSAGDRTVKVTSSSGGVRVQAVIKVPGDFAQAPILLSWRVL